MPLRVYVWIGSIFLVVAALSASHYWAYRKGWTAADQSARIEKLEGDLAAAATEEARLRGLIAEQHKMAEAAQEVARRAAERERTAQSDLQDLEDKFGEYVRQLGAQKPEDRCVLTPEDLARLATLVGKARAPLPASSREKGVPSPSPSKGPASAPPD